MLSGGDVFMKKKLLGSVMLLSATLIWGTAFVAQSAGMALVGSFTFQLGRNVLAAGFLALWVLCADPARFAGQWNNPRLWKSGILCGCALFLASSLQQIGLTETGAGKAGFLTSLYILLVPLLELFFRKRPSRRTVLSLIPAVIGLYLLCGAGGRRLRPCIQRRDFCPAACRFPQKKRKRYRAAALTFYEFSCIMQKEKMFSKSVLTKGRSSSGLCKERNFAMIYSAEVENMCSVAKGAYHGPAPIPEEGKWVQAKEIKDISGFTHGIGWCAPQQGACKLTLNIKEGVIEEALVETIGCSGMTHSAAMAAEILIGKTILEALNTDLVCDAINTAMRELFLQIVYGRSQSAFSEGGLSVGASLEDLGKGLRSQVGTMFATKSKGPRYLEMAEGYVTRVALDEDNLIVGYEFINLGKMMDFIKKGDDANTALTKAKGHYGRFDNAHKYIDPRQE